MEQHSVVMDCGEFCKNHEEEGKSDALWSESETPSKNDELACFSHADNLFGGPLSPPTRESLPQNLDGCDHGAGGGVFATNRTALFATAQNTEEGQVSCVPSQFGGSPHLSGDLSVAYTHSEHVGTAWNGRTSPPHGAAAQTCSTVPEETQLSREEQPLSASKSLRDRNRKTISRYEPVENLKHPVQGVPRPAESAKRGRLSLKKVERNPEDIVWVIDVCEEWRELGGFRLWELESLTNPTNGVCKGKEWYSNLEVAPPDGMKIGCQRFTPATKTYKKVTLLDRHWVQVSVRWRSTLVKKRTQKYVEIVDETCCRERAFRKLAGEPELEQAAEEHAQKKTLPNVCNGNNATNFSWNPAQDRDVGSVDAGIQSAHDTGGRELGTRTQQMCGDGLETWEPQQPAQTVSDLARRTAMKDVGAEARGTTCSTRAEQLPGDEMAWEMKKQESVGSQPGKGSAGQTSAFSDTTSSSQERLLTVEPTALLAATHGSVVHDPLEGWPFPPLQPCGQIRNLNPQAELPPLQVAAFQRSMTARYPTAASSGHVSSFLRGVENLQPNAPSQNSDYQNSSNHSYHYGGIRRRLDPAPNFPGLAPWSYAGMGGVGEGGSAPEIVVDVEAAETQFRAGGAVGSQAQEIQSGGGFAASGQGHSQGSGQQPAAGIPGHAAAGAKGNSPQKRASPQKRGRGRPKKAAKREEAAPPVPVEPIMIVVDDDEEEAAGAASQMSTLDAAQAEGGEEGAYAQDTLFDFLLFVISTGDLGGGQTVFQVQGRRDLLIKASVRFGEDDRVSISSAESRGLVLSLAEVRGQSVKELLTPIGFSMDAYMDKSGRLANNGLGAAELALLERTLEHMRANIKRLNEQAREVGGRGLGKHSYFCSVCGKRFTFPISTLMKHHQLSHSSHS